MMILAVMFGCEPSPAPSIPIPPKAVAIPYSHSALRFRPPPPAPATPEVVNKEIDDILAQLRARQRELSGKRPFRTAQRAPGIGALSLNRGIDRIDAVGRPGNRRLRGDDGTRLAGTSRQRDLGGESSPALAAGRAELAEGAGG